MSDVTIVVENTVEANVTVSNKSPLAEVPDGFFTLAMLPPSLFTANAAGRGKFASGFIDSSLCAAGLYNAIAPAGAVLQTVYVSSSAEATLTAQIPLDNTKPQIGEGTQLISASITPSSASNKILVRYGGMFTAASAANTTFAFFKSGQSDAFYTTYLTLAGADYGYPVFSEIIDSPGSTSSQTYSVRCGPGAAYTIYLNRFYSYGSRFSGTLNQTLCLQEIKA